MMLDPTENMEAIRMWLFHIAKLTIYKYASMFCKAKIMKSSYNFEQ